MQLTACFHHSRPLSSVSMRAICISYCLVKHASYLRRVVLLSWISSALHFLILRAPKWFFSYSSRLDRFFSFDRLWCFELGAVRSEWIGRWERAQVCWAGTHPLCQKIRPVKGLWEQYCQTPYVQYWPFLLNCKSINSTVDWAHFRDSIVLRSESQLPSFEDLIVWEILIFSPSVSQASVPCRYPCTCYFLRIITGWIITHCRAQESIITDERQNMPVKEVQHEGQCQGSAFRRKLKLDKRHVERGVCWCQSREQHDHC